MSDQPKPENDYPVCGRCGVKTNLYYADCCHVEGCLECDPTPVFPSGSETSS